MTTKVFITGDRSVDPVTAFGVTLPVLAGLVNSFGADVGFATGSMNSGVERAVRYILPGVTEFPHVNTDEGYIDFDARHKQVIEDADYVVFIHSDPLASRIGKSLVDIVPEDRLQMVTSF